MGTEIKLVGICGHKQHGKSTVAQAFAREGYERHAFADPFKRMLVELGLTYDHVYGNQKDDKPEILCGKTVRRAMETLGTEWGRNLIGEDIWINAWKTRVVPKILNGAKIVVDDVRFPNEAAAIWGFGGKIIRVTRPELGVPRTTHTSENPEAILENYCISNTGGKEALFCAAHRIIGELRA